MWACNIFNQIFAGLFTAIGNSHPAFLSTSVGLVINIILDPLLIFGIGPFPALKVTGAAIATIIAQMVVTLLFLFFASQDQILFHHIHLLQAPDSKKASEIFRLGLPSCLQSLVFTGISMTIARLVAGYGDAAVAVQKVGAQIESISWMTSDGFASAVNSFIAQNHGAGKESRIRKGTKQAFVVSALFCGVISVLVFLLAKNFMLFFVSPSDTEIIKIGVGYLRIEGAFYIGIGILFLLYGYYRGINFPEMSLVLTIISLGTRVILAYILAPIEAVGVVGIWWAIPVGWFLADVTGIIYMRHRERKNSE